MPSELKIHAFGQSDRGLVRSINEDAVLVDDSLKLYAVADGLGGLPEGALASQLAIKTLHDSIADLPSRENIPDFSKIFDHISSQVHQKGKTIHSDFGIATTLTCLFVEKNTAHIAHSGDSGVFLIRGNEIQRLTSDHTMAQQIKDKLLMDNQTSSSPIPESFTHILTSCIGQAPQVKTETLSISLQAKDLLVIYSDGLTKALSLDEILRLASETQTPNSLVESFIQIANERGGVDNTTVIAIAIG